jgi:hypothetical protein
VSTRPKPLHQEVAKFVEYHLERGCFAPFTGQDFPAWRAFVYLLECYSHGGGESAIAAMRATVRCAQPHERVLRCFVQAIPAVMDWGDVRLWTKIAGDLTTCLADGSTTNALVLAAFERTELAGGEERVTIWRSIDARTGAAP